MHVEQTGAKYPKLRKPYLNFLLDLFSFFILEADVFLSLISLSTKIFRVTSSISVCGT